jgi:hypothetical protein
MRLNDWRSTCASITSSYKPSHFHVQLDISTIGVLTMNQAIKRGSGGVRTYFMKDEYKLLTK